MQKRKIKERVEAIAAELYIPEPIVLVEKNEDGLRNVAACSVLFIGGLSAILTSIRVCYEKEDFFSSVSFIFLIE